MNDQDADIVMTVPEVAIYLKKGRSTIYRMAQSGELPGRKVGGTWRFKRKVIDDWLEECPPVSSQ